MINCKNLDELDWSNKNDKMVIPTLPSSQILSNTKQMYSTIMEYLQDEDLIRIFSVAINDITNNYLGFFMKLKIESKTDALRFQTNIKIMKMNGFFLRVKEELDYFHKSLLEFPFIDLLQEKKAEFEKSMNKIITQNCNNFIQMTSLN